MSLWFLETADENLPALGRNPGYGYPVAAVYSAHRKTSPQAPCLGVKNCDIAQRMHTGIGTAGSDHLCLSSEKF